MLLEQIGSYLQSQSLGTPGVDLFYGSMPDSPDLIICLYETTGYQPTMSFDDDNVEYPGLQIICRGTDYMETKDRINAIYKRLHGNINVNGFMNFIAQQSPFSLGQDEQRRWEFSVNFKIVKNM